MFAINLLIIKKTFSNFIGSDQLKTTVFDVINRMTTKTGFI